MCSSCLFRACFCDLLTFTHRRSAEVSGGVGLGDFSHIRTGIHPRVDVRDGEAVPVMLILVVMPSMLPPDTLVKVALGGIPAVCEVMGPFVEHGGE